MRIGNGPRLVVPRAGVTRRPWGWYGRKSSGQQYDEYRERERARLRRMTHKTEGDRKREAWTIQGAIFLAKRCQKDTTYWRRVDDHGRSYGPRITDISDLPSGTRLRLAMRQPEDYHSQLSRMLKRAHRLSVRED